MVGRSGESKEVSLISRAGRMLSEARTIGDFKHVRDVGEAALRLAKSRREVGIDALLAAQEIVRRAERQIGEMLALSTGGKGGDRKSSNSKLLDPLGNLGIGKMQSSRFQKVAQIPSDEFEEWISECRENGEEMTQAAALRLAAMLTADPIEKPAVPPHEQMAAAIKNAVTKFIGQLSSSEEYAYVRRRLEDLVAFLEEAEGRHGS